MSARETLHALLGMGVRFVIAGEKLRAAADHPISDEVARLIRENLPDLVALLREPVELGTNGTAVAAAAGQRALDATDAPTTDAKHSLPVVPNVYSGGS